VISAKKKQKTQSASHGEICTAKSVGRIRKIGKRFIKRRLICGSLILPLKAAPCGFCSVSTLLVPECVSLYDEV
jgi:hypothetical protein